MGIMEAFGQKSLDLAALSDYVNAAEKAAKFVKEKLQSSRFSQQMLAPSRVGMGDSSFSWALHIAGDKIPALFARPLPFLAPKNALVSIKKTPISLRRPPLPGF